MVHYMFNSSDWDEGIIIRYCQHCNTDLVATFESAEKIKNKGEILNFYNSKKCPLCGSDFCDKTGYNYSTVHLVGDSSFYDSSINSAFNSAQDNSAQVQKRDGYFYIRGEDTINYRCFADQTVKNIPEGEKIMTKYGEGTVLRHRPNSSHPFVAVKFYKEGNVESILAYLKQFRTEDQKNAINTKYEKFIEKCDINSKNLLENNFAVKENLNLKKYLENLLVIEKNIFSISQRLRELYSLDFLVEKDALASEKIKIWKNIRISQKLFVAYEKIKKKDVTTNIKINDFKITYPDKPQKPKEPNKPILAQPGFFNKKRILAENAALTDKYEKELEEYKLATKQYKLDLKNYNETKVLLKEQRQSNYYAAIAKANENLKAEIAIAKENYENSLKEREKAEFEAKDIPTPEKAKHQFLKEEIDTAEDLLKKFYKARSELYSCGIIFEKYQNFVAVSSFYEYISSGRCETLEGTNGAYNIYENETRMNMVIGQLNRVIESLEEIKQNQYMIYSAIQETNSQLSKLNSSMNSAIGTLSSIKADTADMKSYMSEIANNTAVIAYNTERTAFYAKKNAELTNALGFMVAFK